MRTQPRVLRVFARRAQERRPVGFQDLAQELSITDQAAVDCLERLWRLRLITPLGTRPPRFKCRRAPGERVKDLRFRLAPRGEERLRWWAAKGGEKADDWGLFR